MVSTHVEEPMDGIEIDDITYHQIIAKLESDSDPFDSVKLNSLSPKMKRKYYNLQKKLTGNPDSVGTKYIDPEQIVGYSLFDVVYPSQPSPHPCCHRSQSDHPRRRSVSKSPCSSSHPHRSQTR